MKSYLKYFVDFDYGYRYIATAINWSGAFVEVEFENATDNYKLRYYHPYKSDYTSDPVDNTTVKYVIHGTLSDNVWYSFTQNINENINTVFSATSFTVKAIRFGTLAENTTGVSESRFRTHWDNVVLFVYKYKLTSYLESSVFDSAASGTMWQTVTWNSITPANTSIAVYLRSGGDNDPYDGGWSGWCKHDNDTENTSLPDNRYVQYRVELSTTDNTVTPTFNDITINYTKQAVTVDNVYDGTNTITTLDGTKFLKDADENVRMTLQITPAAAPVVCYDNDATPNDGENVTADGSGTSWSAVIPATSTKVKDGDNVRFSVWVDGTYFYRTDTTPWSFLVDGAAPTNVACSTPDNNAGNVAVSATLTALEASDSGSGLHSTSYCLQLATDTGFTQNVQTTGWQAGRTWSPSLNAGTVYY